MRVERHPRFPAFLALGIATLLVVAGCYGGSVSSGPPTDSADATPSLAPPDTESDPPDSTDGCGSATLTIDYAPGTITTFAGYGWDFVVAVVVGFGKATFNTPDGSRPPGFGSRPASPPKPDARTTIYTPVDVVIERVISGPSSPGPGQFLVQGGTVGCFTLDVQPTPNLKPGSTYVLLLSDALDADGEKPLPLSQVVFAWPIDASGQVTTVDGFKSIDELTELVVTASD